MLTSDLSEYISMINSTRHVNRYIENNIDQAEKTREILTIWGGFY